MSTILKDACNALSRMKLKLLLSVLLVILAVLVSHGQQRSGRSKTAYKTQKQYKKKGMTKKSSVKSKHIREQKKGLKQGYGAKTGKAPNGNGINQGNLQSMRDSLERLLVVNTRSSAVLIGRGQFELYHSNQLSGMTYQFDRNGDDAQYRGKDHLFNTTAQLAVGISRQRRINIGIDANYVMYRHDNTSSEPSYSIFNGDPATQTGFGYAGPRVKVRPFRGAGNFVYQTYLWLPLVNESKRNQLGLRDWYWGNTFFVYHYFNQTIGLFGQANVGLAKQKDETYEIDDVNVDISVGLTVSYVVLRRNVFYVPVVYGRSNQSIRQVMEGADSDMLQCGIGYQRVFSRGFQANISYNSVVLAHNYGRWGHINLGFRFVF